MRRWREAIGKGARRFDALLNRIALDDALFALFLLSVLALFLANPRVGVALMLFLFVWAMGFGPWLMTFGKEGEE